MENLEVIHEELSDEVKKARNSLSTDRLDMSYGEIISMYERGDLIIDPEFQRLFRWDDEQKTGFIESLLLGIPIPPIFVAEDDNGRWELVDGLQRISTVLSFVGQLKTDESKNNWTLIEGDLIKKINGLSFENLPALFQRNIRRTYCRVEILKWDSEVDMRYELFNRLNTGGSSLTQQEIRNCIFRGFSNDFNDYLKRIASLDKFNELMNLTEQRELESFLEELVLRVTSLYNNWNNFSTKKMSSHMTKFMEASVKEGFDYSFEDRFKRTINVLHPLGYKIFRFNNNQLSTSLIDAIFVNIAANIDAYEQKSKEQLLDLIELLKKDDTFRKYTGSDSSSKSRVKNRMQRAEEIFTEYINGSNK